MKCNDVQNKFVEFLESGRNEALLEDVKLHLDHCQECAIVFERFKKVLDVPKYDRISTKNHFFLARLDGKLKKEEEGSKTLLSKYNGWSALRAAMVAASIILGVLMGLTMHSVSVSGNDVSREDYLQSFSESMYLYDNQITSIQESIYAE